MKPFNLLRLIRNAPVTMLCLVICGALFLATTRPHQAQVQRLELLDRWGGVVERTLRIVDPMTLKEERDLHGPFALWQGQVWRIPVCAFHHVDLWHLLLNSLAAAYLGRLLERKWGSGRLLLFLPFAATIPLLAEFLCGTYVLGFSGVIAGMFGVLCVLRIHDDDLQEELPEEAVHLGGAMLAFGVLFTILDLAPIANLAHMTGFFYGALAGCVATGLPWGRRRAKLIRFGVILLSVAGLWLVVHPVWDGTYHWYVAMRTKDPNDRYAELQRAVRLDPLAIGAWRHLAAEEARRDEPLAEWKTLLSGLSHNPSDQQLLMLARRAWRNVIITPGRAEAEETIRKVFGDLASAWEAQFRHDQFDLAQSGVVLPAEVSEVDPVVRFSLSQTAILALPESSEPDASSYRIPPEGDAVEGRRM